MKKYNFFTKLLFVLGLPILIIGCDSDDDSGATTDFLTIETSFQEANGPTTITIPFRNASSTISESDLVFDGTATEGEDYEIVGVTEDGVEISLLDDVAAEALETIRISITGSTGNAIHTTTLVSDDPGFIDIDLEWAAAVDMDLILVYKAEEDDEFEVFDFSDPGHLTLDWSEDDGIYGLSYNYFSGSVEPLDFTVTFTPTGVKLEGATDPLVFNATYTLDNVDPANFQIEQMFTKNGTEFTDFTDITVPAEGSRKKAELVVKMREAIAKYRAGK